MSSDSDAECSLSVDEDVLSDVHAAAAATQHTARQFTSYIRCLRKEGQFISMISVRRGVAMRSTGVVLSTPVLPEAVPGIDTDPVSFYRGGGKGWSGLKFDWLPYIN